MKKPGFHTLAVHAGQHPDPLTGSLATPIYQTSTFVFKNAEQGAARFAGEEEGYIYSRIGNPTVTALEEKIAALEGGEAGLAFGSGMAAISALLFYLAQSGDHIVTSPVLYGSTHGLLHDVFPRYGVKAEPVDLNDEQALRNVIKENTKVIYVETPANPTMDLVDLAKVIKVAKEHNIPVVVDNTFMSPYLQRPLELGADFIIHSATKYISGHGDVLGGLIVGSKEHITGVRRTTLKDIGGNIDPFAAWLLLRGLKTLPVRVQRHSENAMEVARFLKSHPAVLEVYYPGLPDFPQYDLAKEQMDGFGGVLAFEVKGGVDAGRKVINSVKLCHVAVSLGDVDSLIEHPASMTHAGIPLEDRLSMNITDGLIRLSVGLEDPEDIIDDLKQALEQI